jgi:peptidoglycan/LPS O-acetylase OafA/YrhL
MLWLYPRDFRREYRSDLVQNFNDLLVDHGIRSAWARTSIDLIVTVPRFRLESIMSEQKSAVTINVALAVLVAGAMLAMATGFYPITPVLLITALVLAFVQRGALARAIRTPGTNRRRNRFVTAAVLMIVVVINWFSFLNAVSDDEISTTSLLIYNAIGVPAMIGAVVYLIVGLLTPRVPRTTQNA